MWNRGDKKEVFDEKCSPPRTAKASNLGRGWNFTWDGQAGLGHPPWRRGGSPGREAVCKGEGEGVLEGPKRPEAG